MKAREQSKNTYGTDMGISVTLCQVLSCGRGWVLGYGSGWVCVMGLQLLKPSLHAECWSFCYCCNQSTDCSFLGKDSIPHGLLINLTLLPHLSNKFLPYISIHFLILAKAALVGSHFRHQAY